MYATILSARFLFGLLEARRSMTITQVRCGCGVVEVQLTGAPVAQYVCHCVDCQAVHGKAYPVALYPASAVVVTHRETGPTSVARFRQSGFYLSCWDVSFWL